MAVDTWALVDASDAVRVTGGEAYIRNACQAWNNGSVSGVASSGPFRAARLVESTGDAGAEELYLRLVVAAVAGGHVGRNAESVAQDVFQLVRSK